MQEQKQPCTGVCPNKHKHRLASKLHKPQCQEGTGVTWIKSFTQKFKLLASSPNGTLVCKNGEYGTFTSRFLCYRHVMVRLLYDNPDLKRGPKSNMTKRGVRPMDNLHTRVVQLPQLHFALSHKIHASLCVQRPLSTINTPYYYYRTPEYNNNYRCYLWAFSSFYYYTSTSTP